MIVNTFNQQDALGISENQVELLVNQVIKEEGQSCDEVSIYFVNTAEICHLHEEYFADPSPTDCISFPMDNEEEDFDYRLLGDVFVCPQTALDYATSHSADPYEETTLYIVHGLLHLMGYRDMEEEEIQRMREAEQKHMKKLKKLDLYLQPVIE